MKKTIEAKENKTRIETMGSLHDTVTWYKIRHAGWQKNATASKTKRFPPAKRDFSLFWMSHWVAYQPAGQILYHLTALCKGPFRKKTTSKWNKKSWFGQSMNKIEYNCEVYSAWVLWMMFNKAILAFEFVGKIVNCISLNQNYWDFSCGDYLVYKVALAFEWRNPLGRLN